MKDKIVIDPETGCHNWTGAKSKNGYGQIGYNGKVVLVHRLAYEQHTGQKIPKGQCVLHECDNPSCCNPEHLKLGTQQDNMNDRNGKGRQARLKGENHGQSKLTDEQVLEIRASPKTQMQLAKEYGVSQMQISRIKRRESWNHI